MTHQHLQTLTILPSASRAVRTVSDDVKNPHAIGGHFVFRVTVNNSTVVSPRFIVEGRVPGTTKYYTIGTVGTATGSTANGIRRLFISPGLSTEDQPFTGEEEVVSQPLPYIYRVSSTATSTGSITYSAGVDLIG